MRKANLLVIIYIFTLSLLFLPHNLIAKKYPDVEASLKKATLLSRTVKLGEILELEVELEKPIEGKYPVILYLKDAEGKSIVASVRKEEDFIMDSTKYNFKFEIPENIPISSFWPDDALSHKVSIRIGDSEEKDIGTIGLYRKWQIIRDGIIVLPGFKIPFYVVLMAFLGAIGYVFTSILKRPEFTRKNIRKWVFRLALGPLFGVFLYSISTLINPSPDPYIIGALCFATGFYISPIQSKMRDFVYEKLAPDKKLEDDIAELEADESELISRIAISKRVAYYLKKEGITSIADLSATSQEKLNLLAKSSGIDEEYLKNKKTEAENLDKKNLSKLNIPLAIMKKLPKEIKYMEDLITLDVSEIKHKFSSDEQKILNKFIDEAKTKIKM